MPIRWGASEDGRNDSQSALLLHAKLKQALANLSENVREKVNTSVGCLLAKYNMADASAQAFDRVLNDISTATQMLIDSAARLDNSAISTDKDVVKSVETITRVHHNFMQLAASSTPRERFELFGQLAVDLTMGFKLGDDDWATLDTVATKVHSHAPLLCLPCLCICALQ